MEEPLVTLRRSPRKKKAAPAHEASRPAMVPLPKGPKCPPLPSLTSLMPSTSRGKSASPRVLTLTTPKSASRGMVTPTAHVGRTQVASSSTESK